MTKNLSDIPYPATVVTEPGLVAAVLLFSHKDISDVD